jgi:hypothetical protein
MLLWVIQMNTTVTPHIETWNERGGGGSAYRIMLTLQTKEKDSVYQPIYQIA